MKIGKIEKIRYQVQSMSETETDWIIRWVDGIGQERETVYWDRNAAIAEIKRLRSYGNSVAARIYERTVKEVDP